MRILIWQTNLKSDFNGRHCRQFIQIFRAHVNTKRAVDHSKLNRTARVKNKHVEVTAVLCKGKMSHSRLPVRNQFQPGRRQRADGSHRHHREICVDLCGSWRDDTPALHGLSAAQAPQCKQAYRRQSHFHTSGRRHSEVPAESELSQSHQNIW